MQRNEEEEDRKMEAFERLKDDISIVDDDHLDITLVQEEMFLIQYLSLLGKKWRRVYIKPFFVLWYYLYLLVSCLILFSNITL